MKYKLNKDSVVTHKNLEYLPILYITLGITRIRAFKSVVHWGEDISHMCLQIKLLRAFVPLSSIRPRQLITPYSDLLSNTERSNEV